jgi:hypothetical protein
MADGLINGQAGMNRALGVILMSLRKSEIDKGAVTHVPRDKAIKASHHAGYALLIRANNVP